MRMGGTDESTRRVDDVAAAVGGVVHGDGALRLEGLAPLESAGPTHLAFLARPDYLKAARASAAGCVMAAAAKDLPGRCVIEVADPYRALALALRLFHPSTRPVAGISTQADIHPSAVLGADVHAAAFVSVGARSRIGERAVLHAGVVIGEDCEVGDDAILHPGAVLYPRTLLGRRVIVHARAVLGSDGFGYSSGPDGHVKITHVGRVVVEDDVEIGAGTCIDRGALDDTRIGAGTKIDNLVQVAHGVTVGDHCLLVAQSGIAGSTSLGRFAVLAGQSGVAGHLSIGAGARVAAKSAVLSDVEAGATVGGVPAIPLAAWRRAAIAFGELPDLLRRLRRLEGRTSAQSDEKDGDSSHD